MSTDKEKMARCYVRRELRSILARIALFQADCKRTEYTDTSEAHAVLENIACDARAAMRHLA